MTSKVEMGLDELLAHADSFSHPQVQWGAITIADAAATLPKLASALRSLRQDAERYRWLRNNNACESKHDGVVHIGLPTEDEPDAELNWHEPEELDSAIDSCLQADKGER